MNPLFKALSAGLIPCCFLATALPAEEPQPEASRQVPETKTADVDKLLTGLSSGKYKDRNDATQELKSVGKSAIAPVAKAADTADIELSARCVEILKHYYQKGNEEAKSAAEAALKKLSDSKHSSVSKWAAEAIRKPDPVQPNDNPFNGGVIRLQIGGIPGRRVRGANVVRPVLQREAKATEDGKTIEILERRQPNREIVVKITEKVDGKEKTTEHKAKSAMELKQKNQKVFDLYQKHIKGARWRFQFPNAGRGMPIRGAAGVGGGGMQINTRIINGQRKTSVTEANGRKISISDTNGKDIKMEVSETVNGKEKSTKYEAKDLGELKKKHPDAARIYEQYSKNAIPFNGGVFGRNLQLQLR